MKPALSPVATRKMEIRSPLLDGNDGSVSAWLPYQTPYCGIGLHFNPAQDMMSMSPRLSTNSELALAVSGLPVGSERLASALLEDNASNDKEGSNRFMELFVSEACKAELFYKRQLHELVDRMDFLLHQVGAVLFSGLAQSC